MHEIEKQSCSLLSDFMKEEKMCFEILATSVFNVFKVCTSICTCMDKPEKFYDVLCGDKVFLYCAGNLDHPIRLTLKRSVVFHDMPSLILDGYETVIPGEHLLLKNTGTSRNCLQKI